jgi:hypothetical protein
MMADEEKKPYLRWHAAESDPTGAFRSSDPASLESLNTRTMEVLHEEALEEYESYLIRLAATFGYD